MSGIRSTFVAGKRAHIRAEAGDYDNTQGRCYATVPYDNTKPPLDNHAAAVAKLVHLLELQYPGKWAGDWHRGDMRGGYYWVRDNAQPVPIGA